MFNNQQQLFRFRLNQNNNNQSRFNKHFVKTQSIYQINVENKKNKTKMSTKIQIYIIIKKIKKIKIEQKTSSFTLTIYKIITTQILTSIS